MTTGTAGTPLVLGLTPLMEAARRGDKEMVALLLHQGANIDEQNLSGDTALIYACENGHTEVASLLLKYEANLELESEAGMTALMKACQGGHLEIVQLLISKNVNLDKTSKNNMFSPLSMAVTGGHIKVLELLLENKADASHKLQDDKTLLMLAAEKKNMKIMKILNDFYASSNKQSATGAVADSDFAKKWEPVRLLISELDSMPLSKEKKIKTQELVVKLLPLMKDVKKNKEAADDLSKLARIVFLIMFSLPTSLKEAATGYFKIYFARQNKEPEGDFEFSPKVEGDQIGGKMSVNFKKEKKLVYYIKTHQHGSNIRNSSAKLVDAKELLVYKVLEKIGLGPKAHFFYFRFEEEQLLIATQDCSYSKDPEKEKEFLTYEKVTAKYSKDGLPKHYDSIKGVAQVDLFSRIFVLNDAITNSSNFGVVTLQEKYNKWKIFDFRTDVRYTYLDNQIYEHWLAGNHILNYCEHTETIIKDRPKEDRLATAKIILEEFIEGRRSKKGYRKMSFQKALMEGYLEVANFVAENSVRMKIRNVPNIIGKWNLGVLKNISLEDFSTEFKSMPIEEAGDLGQYIKEVVVNFETLASNIMSETYQQS